MNRLLNIQVQLLVVQYGRQQVMEELAGADGADRSTLQGEVESLRVRAGQEPKAKRSRRRKSPRELIHAAQLAPDLKPLMERIVAGYQGKEFLPELWRVKKFLESEGVPAANLRSRADALPKVIGALANRSPENLKRLISDWESGSGGSDLAVLAGAIMRPVQQVASGAGD